MDTIISSSFFGLLCFQIEVFMILQLYTTLQMMNYPYNVTITKIRGLYLLCIPDNLSWEGTLHVDMTIISSFSKRNLNLPLLFALSMKEHGEFVF